MASNFPHRTPPRAQVFAENAFAALSRFLHIEAVSGILLLMAAAAALIWANSPYSDSYHALWHARIGVDIGGFSYVQSLHFWINDALMTVFFLVVGMEIRREIHEGALASIRLASLPLAAAVGGVLLPAAIYLVFNTDPATRVGWAVPTATDIAFAVGVLALLGRAIPGSVRIFLLALAIIDDIVAVLIIALFYSGGLDYTGLAVAALGIAMVLGLQRVGAGSALAYIVPGAVLWTGLLMTGAHPTLAGVVLGLLTPVALRPAHHAPLHLAASAVGDLQARQAGAEHDPHHLGAPLRQLRLAQRDMLPPVTRVQMALHPWVAFGVMPLFALANAGVTLDGINLAADGSRAVLAGVLVALALGKPMGVVAASWLAVRVGGCQLPEGMNWPAVWLVGLLAGIGFTMSIFIATLAFQNLNLLAAAKLGVLMASVLSALLGLAWGRAVVVRRTRSHSRGPDPSSA